MKKKLILGLYLLSTLFCWAQEKSTFASDWQAWRAQREQGLVGWRNLTGLYWLEAGEHTFGFGQDAEHIFPTHRSPSPGILGSWILQDEVVCQKTATGIDTLYAKGESKSFTWEGWSWFVIRRGDRWAIRARDTRHPDLATPVVIPNYPVDSDWRIKGKWQPSTAELSILDITGQVTLQRSAGRVAFKVHGKTHHLEALGTMDELFFLVGDQTNSKDTYGGGRYLYSKVEADGTVWLDFNRLINPPCAFTPFATCPLPPKENRLRVALQAGEKRINH